VDERYAFNATNIAEFPLCDQRPLSLARTLDILAEGRGARTASLLLAGNGGAQPLPARAALDAARQQLGDCSSA